VADNTQLGTPVGSGDVIATDDIAALSAKVQRVKAGFGTDGSYTDVSSSNPLPVDGSGVTQPVSAASLPLPTGAATSAKQDTGNTSLASIDTKLVAAQTADFDTGAGTATTQMLGIALPASGGPVAGGTSSNPLRVDPTGTTTQPVSGTVTANLAAGTNNIGDVDVLTVNGVAPAFGSGVRGATVQRVTVATDDVVPASQSGTWTVQPGNTANTTAWLVDPRGNVAHDGADSGNPVKVGLKATTSLAGLTLVANADRTDVFAGVDGVQITRPHANLEDLLQDRAADTGGTSTAFAGGFAAPGAGIRLWATMVIVHNSNTTTTGSVDIRDGAAGSVLAAIPAPANGGAIVPFQTPLKFTANTAAAYDVSAAISTVTITILGFKSKI